MKTRIGITSPLVLKRRDHGLLRLPYFTERNFGMTPGLEHSIWMEAATPLDAVTDGDGLTKEQPRDDLYALRGVLSDEILCGMFSIRADRSADVMTSWTEDHCDDGFIVGQTIEAMPVKAPQRIIFVVDGSARMEAGRSDIETALSSVPEGMEFGVLLASDTVRELIDTRSSTRTARTEAAKPIAKVNFAGGCDNVSALIAAWDLAAAKPDSAIVWLHATQPIEMQTSEALLQRWERRPNNPKLYDLQFGIGPNRVLKSLDGLRAIRQVPDFGDTGAALEDLLNQWNQGSKRLVYRRWREASAESEERGRRGSSHIARLYFASEICRLGASRDSTEVQQGVLLAKKYKLVTPISGAVVLENQRQYEEAGLTPADPNDMPAIVPEPETWVLLIIGMAIMLVAGSRKHRLARERTA